MCSQPGSPRGLSSCASLSSSSVKAHITRAIAQSWEFIIGKHTYHWAISGWVEYKLSCGSCSERTTTPRIGTIGLWANSLSGILPGRCTCGPKTGCVIITVKPLHMLRVQREPLTHSCWKTTFTLNHAKPACMNQQLNLICDPNQHIVL